MFSRISVCVMFAALLGGAMVRTADAQFAVIDVASVGRRCGHLFPHRHTGACAEHQQ